MLLAKIKQFSCNETGGGTIMGIFWFMALVAICGLAVDVTDGLRNRTMLQATADATALAAAIDLPSSSAAVATAVSYSVDNMGIDINGHVLDVSDVQVGLWDEATNTLDTSATLPDAVMVTVHRAESNFNALPTNFLRITGFQSWNVSALAVAQRFIPECLRDGLVARGMVDMSSNNGFVNQICIHGQQGVDMQIDNTFQSGVTVSMPNLGMLVTPSGSLTSNPGLPQALRENYLDPRMVNHIDEVIAKLRGVLPDDGIEKVIPEYIRPITPTYPVIAATNKVDFTTMNFLPGEGRIYDIDCKGNPTVNVPGGTTLSNVVIVIECNLSVNPGATLNNVVLASYRIGHGQDPLNHTNISFSGSVQIGAPDNCATGGGVQIYSAASVHFSSSSIIDGLQVVAAGDIELGAQAMGINGISAQAGQDITLTSNNMFGLCSGGAPDTFTVPYYRLVL